jgi:prefoldin subunit 5
VPEAGERGVNMKRPVFVRILVVAACGLAAPGCVVRDIHDELVGVNERLARVEVALGEIDRTNDALADLQVRLELLEKIASVDESLRSMDGQLHSIQGSLSNLDEHLASLRRTISNIDSTIPFLRLSGDEPGSEEPGEGAPPPPPAGGPAAGSGGDGG